MKIEMNISQLLKRKRFIFFCFYFLFVFCCVDTWRFASHKIKKGVREWTIAQKKKKETNKRKQVTGKKKLEKWENRKTKTKISVRDGKWKEKKNMSGNEKPPSWTETMNGKWMVGKQSWKCCVVYSMRLVGGLNKLNKKEVGWKVWVGNM